MALYGDYNNWYINFNDALDGLYNSLGQLSQNLSNVNIEQNLRCLEHQMQVNRQLQQITQPIQTAILPKDPKTALIELMNQQIKIKNEPEIIEEKTWYA